MLFSIEALPYPEEACQELADLFDYDEDGMLNWKSCLGCRIVINIYHSISLTYILITSLPFLIELNIQLPHVCVSKLCTCLYPLAAANGPNNFRLFFQGRHRPFMYENSFN